MESGAKRTGLRAAAGLALLAVIVALAAWMGTGASEDHAEANHQELTLGIDTNVTGNDALALGTLQACRVLSDTNAFNVDIYLQNVDDIAAFELYLRYDPNDIVITKPGDGSQGNNDLFMLQQAQPSPPGNDFQNLSEPLPDTSNPGIYRLQGADLAVVEGSPDPDPINQTHMDGVLVRLELQGKSSFVTFPGKSTNLEITPFEVSELQQEVGPTITSSTGTLVGDYNNDTWVDNVINATLVSDGGTCTDSDGDGVPDSSDNCPTVSNPGQEDTDGDGEGDACDIDDDGDGIVDTSEVSGCEKDPDCDDDGVSDGPNDPDGTGPIVAGPDNCLLTPNPDQIDTDGDGQGDACDTDDDGDGVLDGADNCPTAYNPSQANYDGDSMGDACDPDDDNDGYTDADEAWIGTNSLDECGAHTTADPIYSQAWPADVFSKSGTLDSKDKITIQDLASFVAPVRILNKNPEDPEFHIRWDLVPGSGVLSNQINIQDMGSLVTVKPPMFGGEDRAFNYPDPCVD